MASTRLCYRCERTYTDDRRVRCACGEPLWDDASPPSVRSTDGQTPCDRPLQRYLESLPVTDLAGIATGAGGTPTVRVPGLDDVAGCRVVVKDEGQNPTGSYKDRGSAVAVSRALEWGVEAVGTVSYGNMAMSTAAHAASTGLECVVLVPSEISAGRLELIGQYGPRIVQVDGEYASLYGDALDLHRERSLAVFLSDDPSRIAGYKTAFYELYEDLAPEVPDAIVVPTSSGGFASGLWRGILDLKGAGLLETPPRLYPVQTAAADPITRAFEAGADRVTAVPPVAVEETIAHSIGNPDPPSGTRALTAARETGGAVVSVTDDELRAAQAAYARRGGFCVEPASAASLAGVARLTDDGQIRADETAVLIPTGTGFKELGTGARSVRTETVSRTDLEAHIVDEKT